MARARDGDLHAFEALYRVCIGRVYALCLRLSGDPVQAEDLVQDVFLRVWEKMHTFAGHSRFTTWLYRLAVNRITDRMRADVRRAMRETALEEGLGTGGTSAGRTTSGVSRVPDTSGQGGGASAARTPPFTAAADASIELERAMATLPDGARAVFVLHDVEGYRHDEIAEMLGIASGTSKAQLHRARRLLRERLSR